MLVNWSNYHVNWYHVYKIDPVSRIIINVHFANMIDPVSRVIINVRLVNMIDPISRVIINVRLVNMIDPIPRITIIEGVLEIVATRIAVVYGFPAPAAIRRIGTAKWRVRFGRRSAATWTGTSVDLLQTSSLSSKGSSSEC